MKKIKEIFNDVLGAFDTKPTGYSARKLSAFVVMIMVVVLHIKWFKSDKWEYIGEVLGFDFLFILTCLGLATWQSIKERQND